MQRVGSRRGQATVEYLGLLVAVLLVAGLVVTGIRTPVGKRTTRAVSSALHVQERHGDRWELNDGHYGRLVRLYVPNLVLERDRYGRESSVPVDFASCRALACAAYGTGRPAIYVHIVDQPGRTYFEYWFYYPDSRTSHWPGEAAGYHLDDWEGAITRVDDDGGVYERVSTHAGFTGARPYWNDDPGWRPVSSHPTIYRAAGSHGNAFSEASIDLAADTWNGTLATLHPSGFTLLPGDEAPAARKRFSADATPPWTKLVWTQPETITTGQNPVPGRLTRAAGVWGAIAGAVPGAVTGVGSSVVDAVPTDAVESSDAAVDRGLGGARSIGTHVRLAIRDVFRLFG